MRASVSFSAKQRLSRGKGREADVCTLANERPKKIEQAVQEPFKNRKVKRPKINRVPQGLDHGGRNPNAHVLLTREARQVLWARFENGEDRKDELFAHDVPELGWELSTMGFEVPKETLQRPEKI